MVRARFTGETDELCCINGNIYDILWVLNKEYCAVVDELGDEVLGYLPAFEIVEGSLEELDVYETNPETHEAELVREGKKHS